MAFAAKAFIGDGVEVNRMDSGYQVGLDMADNAFSIFLDCSLIVVIVGELSAVDVMLIEIRTMAVNATSWAIYGITLKGSCCAVMTIAAIIFVDTNYVWICAAINSVTCRAEVRVVICYLAGVAAGIFMVLPIANWLGLVCMAVCAVARSSRGKSDQGSWTGICSFCSHGGIVC